MDVQLYLFINGAWQEYNPKPAVHNHTISEVTGLQAQLNSKLNLAGGTMTGPITMGSNNITGNNSSIFQAGRIIATNSNTNAHGITSKGTRANMLYLMDGVTGGLAASLLDVDVNNGTTPQKRIAKIGIYGGGKSGPEGTPSANYLWLSAVEDNTYNKDATLKVDAQNRVGIAIAGSGRPTQALDVDGKIRMRTATVDADGSDIVVTKGYMLSKIASSDTNNYLTNVSGSANGVVTLTRQGLVPLTWDATHDHNSLYNTKTEITSLLAGKQSAITGAATTITSSDLTENRALISNGSGKVAVSPVTSTELGYLSGVTSSIQTQLNSKLSASDVSAWAKKSSLDHGDIPYATSNTKGGVRVKVVGTSVYIYTTD